MVQNEITDKLILFGLTRQEAVLYLCLIRKGELTGYEAAKLTGVSRSNVYNALAGLAEKGAAYFSEGNSSKYAPVPVSEFCDNGIRRLKQAAVCLESCLPALAQAADGYITIAGYQNIMDKAHHMMLSAEKRMYLSAGKEFVLLFEKELDILCGRGIKVVILTDESVMIDRAAIYLGKKKERQLHLITDSKYVLTGELQGNTVDTCLYSGQKNFVSVLKEALKNEIKVIELTGGEAGDE